MDVKRQGIWELSNPIEDAYFDERFVPAGGTIEIAVLGESIDTTHLFPLSE